MIHTDWIAWLTEWTIVYLSSPRAVAAATTTCQKKKGKEPYQVSIHEQIGLYKHM